MRMKASEVGEWLRQIAGKRDHREVLSDDDRFVLWPGPNFDWLMGNSAGGQPTSQAPEGMTGEDSREGGDHAARGLSPCAWARDADEKASTVTESPKR